MNYEMKKIYKEDLKKKKKKKWQKVENFKKLGALWSLEQFSVWADAFFLFYGLQWSYTVFE